MKKTVILLSLFWILLLSAALQGFAQTNPDKTLELIHKLQAFSSLHFESEVSALLSKKTAEMAKHLAATEASFSQESLKKIKEEQRREVSRLQAYVQEKQHEFYYRLMSSPSTRGDRLIYGFRRFFERLHAFIEEVASNSLPNMSSVTATPLLLFSTAEKLRKDLLIANASTESQEFLETITVYLKNALAGVSVLWEKELDSALVHPSYESLLNMKQELNSIIEDIELILTFAPLIYQEKVGHFSYQAKLKLQRSVQLLKTTRPVRFVAGVGQEIAKSYPTKAIPLIVAPLLMGVFSWQNSVPAKILVGVMAVMNIGAILVALADGFDPLVLQRQSLLVQFPTPTLREEAIAFLGRILIPTRDSLKKLGLLKDSDFEKPVKDLIKVLESSCELKLFPPQQIKVAPNLEKQLEIDFENPPRRHRGSSPFFSNGGGGIQRG